MIITAEEVEVGNWIKSTTSGGASFKVGKIEKKADGRLAIYDTLGALRHVSGKKVKFVWC